MLIKNYRLHFEGSHSNPSDDKLEAMAEIDADISDLLPYINAELGPGLFDPNLPYLRIPQPKGVMIFYADKVGVSRCRDQEDGRRRIEVLIEKVNDIAARRHEIEPSYRSLGDIKALDVLKLLPRTNCKQCGHPTCLAFAAAVAMGKARPEDCAALNAPEFADQREELLRIASWREPRG